MKIRTWEVSRVWQKDDYPDGQYQLHVQETALWVIIARQILNSKAHICCRRFTWRLTTPLHWCLDKVLERLDNDSYSINVTRDVAWQVDEHFVGQVERDVDDD